MFWCLLLPAGATEDMAGNTTGRTLSPCIYQKEAHQGASQYLQSLSQHRPSFIPHSLQVVDDELIKYHLDTMVEVRTLVILGYNGILCG